MTALVWFRRDLRIHDHPALTAAVSSGPAVGLFVLDPRLLSARTVGERRIRFLLESLAELQRSLSERGIPLLVREGPPEEEVLEAVRRTRASAVHVSREYTPYGRWRDRRVRRRLETVGVRWFEHPGVLVGEPEAFRLTAATRLPSFSAFFARARRIPLRPPAVLPSARQRAPAFPSEPVPAPREYGSDVPLPPDLLPGEGAARDRLARFVATRLRAYRSSRETLDVAATSSLSQDLHFGLLSPREVLAACQEEPLFVRQLFWREYAHFLLWHRPDLRERPFRLELARIPWRRDPDTFARWREGRTGYPLVDAAMRELSATGRMPNRLRMLTASFLTKDLLIDWRLGAAHFLRQLIDGDVANNTLGWQWAASLGVDASLPFRDLSPERHARRFDPDGTYVGRWVPEAREGLRGGYPTPIVEHREAIARARVLWREAGRTASPTVEDRP